MTISVGQRIGGRSRDLVRQISAEDSPPSLLLARVYTLQGRDEGYPTSNLVEHVAQRSETWEACRARNGYNNRLPSPHTTTRSLKVDVRMVDGLS